VTGQAGGRTPYLTMDVRDEPDSHLVMLRGELDVAAAADLQARLLSVAGSTVVVDLSGLTFIDAAGVGVLVDTRAKLEGEGHRVVLRGASGLVRRVFDLLNLQALLDS
jgi:anti-sigma B factor antagonist